MSICREEVGARCVCTVEVEGTIILDGKDEGDTSSSPLVAGN